ncbi:hypothetical protein [Nonomuraea endophytica]|uniref:Uncharacterized protein n=1 Tax=Nonomuraea endophytica TaxID=714136 RepID=A0A7W8A4P8_9ACTN|nr:hypothetical protein [Nonomuraea endophytica]MBB5079532.1 hypothetical protein [Nonomuraea endophytica]
MKAITKIGTVVAAGAFSLALAGTAAPAASATTAAPASISASATTASLTSLTARPMPSVKWLCGKRIIKKLIPACTNGKWELVTIKKMRCLQGHAPYVGWTGPSKLSYWAMRCFKTDEWQKW